MRISLLSSARVGSCAVAFTAFLAACPNLVVLKDSPADAPPSRPSPPTTATCGSCVSNSDCSGGACVQIGGDDACALLCISDADCAPSERCTQLVSSDGTDAFACAPMSGSCDPNASPCGACPGSSTCDVATGTCVINPSSSPPSSETCGTFLGPDAHAQCSSCAAGQTAPNGDACQQNGCYGGWWCETTANQCKPPPTGCDDSTTPPSNPNPTTCGTLIAPESIAQCSSCNGSGQTCQQNGCYGGWWCDGATNTCKAPPTSCDNNPPPNNPPPNSPPPPSTTPTGSVGNDGGTVSTLYFAVIGDTRPPNIDGTSHYPSSIINSIYADIEALSPKPLFVVTTGDSMFASTSSGQAQPQLDMYKQAMQQFSGGPVFATMGNHECTGATAGNCSSLTASDNIQAFMSTFMAPIGKTKPYYSLHFDAADGTWTANMAFIACNAWSSTQATFLTQQLETSDTYHIVVRHEPLAVSNAPCSHDANSIIESHKVDLVLAGHTHTFKHVGNEVVIGTGGAPMVDSTPPGYALVSMTSSGFHVTQIDAGTNGAISQFTIPFAP